MTEFRRDPVIGQWVLTHTTDSWGPSQYEKEDHSIKQKATCQFCPGKEHQTPSEVDAVRLNGSKPNSSDWLVRVIPNKFPALKIEGDVNLNQRGMFEFSEGVGAHEVIIETPRHEHQFADFSIDEMVNVLKKYQSRILDLEKDRRFKYVSIFRNYGSSAGATVEHAHSQIIALPMIPKHVQRELTGAQNYYNEFQTCAFCDMISQEIEEKDRIIRENTDFISFCPFVSRYPFEVWVISKDHNLMFTDLQDSQLKSLADVFKDTLLRMKVSLSDPAYNFYLHISPINYERQESFHWHIEIVPKLTKFSGFEWGTGFFVVRTDPYKAAQHLKEASV